MLRKCALIFIVCHTGLTCSVTATWTGMAGDGEWFTANNWSPATVPQAAGDIANFTNPTPTAPTTITITDDSVVLTELNFDYSASYTIQQNGGGLFFSGSSSSINITTTNGNGSYTIVPNTSLLSDLSIVQNSLGTLTISGQLQNIGNVTKSGIGTLILLADNSGYSGSITIDEGTIRALNDSNLGASSNLLTISNGVLSYSDNTTTSRPFTLSGNAGIQAAADKIATLNGDISGSGSLTISDGGTVILAGSNGYVGTTLSVGTLTVTSDGNLGSSSGFLNIGNGQLNISFNTARSGSITGNAIMNSATNVLLSGHFTGAGNLTVQGGGTFTLIGNNQYSGGTLIKANTQLAGTTAGLQGNITLDHASSQVTFSQNLDGTYTGALAGPANSQLTKLGTGNIVFTGSSAAFLGSTSIGEGTLTVNGSLVSSPTTVLLGATLAGSGTVGQTTNQGTLDPGMGSTIGTLSINGSLTYMAGASTNITLSPLAADQIAVNGAATLLGPLQVTPIPAFYGFVAEYPIVTSTGLAGTFDPPTSTVSAFIPSVTYTATEALLHIIFAQPFAAFPFSNENTAAVGHNLDAIFAAGQLSQDLTNILNSWVGQSNAAINAALDQMHPAQYSSFTEMQAELNSQLISLFHRLPYAACTCSCPTRFWIEGLGNSLTMKNHGIELGFQANSGGIAFGWDGQITENCTFGGGGAWTDNTLEWREDRGHGHMTGLYGGLYFDSQIDNFYIGAACLAGMDLYHTSRHLHFFTTNRHAHADYQALDITGQIATAYLFGSPQAFLYPYANFDYLYVHTYSFSEQGADGLDLNVFSQNDGTLRSELGLGFQIQDINAAETICISPRVSLGWVNMYPVQRPKWTATFEGASIPFSVVGWDQTWNLFNVSFDLSISFQTFSFLISYRNEFSPDSDTTLSNQYGNIRFSWQW